MLSTVYCLEQEHNILKIAVAIKKYPTTPVNNKCCQLSSACFAKLMCGLAQNAPGQPHIGANLLAATTTANIGVQV